MSRIKVRRLDPEDGTPGQIIIIGADGYFEIGDLTSIPGAAPLFADDGSGPLSQEDASDYVYADG